MSLIQPRDDDGNLKCAKCGEFGESVERRSSHTQKATVCTSCFVKTGYKTSTFSGV